MIWSNRVLLSAMSLIVLIPTGTWAQSKSAESSVELVRNNESSPIGLGLGLCILSTITLILLYWSVSGKPKRDDE